MPALASALRQAGVGPVSMMVGSLPITAAARMRARGFRPAFLPPSWLPMSISAAPSTMPLRVAGVVHVVDASPPWCTCAARWRRSPSGRWWRSWPPAWPSPRGSRCRGWSRRRSSSGRPAMSVTGITARLKCPAARAAAARLCELSAKASTSVRLKPSIVAIRSAPMPCGTKPSLSLTRGSIAQAPPSLPIVQRLMLSTPPPTTRSSKPLATLAAARFTALQARCAEAALRDAGAGLRPFGIEHRGARDVGALLAHGRDAAEHHVVDQRGVELVAALHLLEQRAQQPRGRGLVQAAVFLALAARRAQVVVDVGVAH